MERVGGVMVYDVTQPASPAFVTYLDTRSATGGDKGSEGPQFLRAAQSPTGFSREGKVAAPWRFDVW